MDYDEAWLFYCLCTYFAVDTEVQATVKETFGNVVRAHYVERCPAPEPSVSPRPPPEKRSRSTTVSILHIFPVNYQNLKI
jgi:hypothetical protein